jgi:26S proteasome regulatory subunit T6
MSIVSQILPSKVDPLVSLMRVEKVPDSTYETLGGLEKQVHYVYSIFLAVNVEDN